MYCHTISIPPKSGPLPFTRGIRGWVSGIKLKISRVSLKSLYGRMIRLQGLHGRVSLQGLSWGTKYVYSAVDSRGGDSVTAHG